MNLRMIKLSLILLLLGFAIDGIYAATDKIIAVVNNNVITQSELNNKLVVMRQHLERVASKPISSSQLRQKVLDDLIDKELQLQIAERNNIQVSEKEVTDAVLSIAQRNKLTLMQLQQELAKQGVKYADFRKQIHDDILLGRLSHHIVGSKVTVSEEEINNFLQKEQSVKMVNNADIKVYRVLDILVPTTAKPGDEEYVEARKVVDNILQQLQEGKNLESMVKNNSFKGKPLVGIDLGWREVQNLPDLFRTVVTKLNPRDAAGPIVAPNGMHIVILIEVRSKGAAPAVAMRMTRGEAREIIYRNKMTEALKPWIKQLRDTAYIQVFNE